MKALGSDGLTRHRRARIVTGERQEGQMDVNQLFLDQHGAVHSTAVGGNKASAAERAFAGLTDEQMRVRPR
jgi:hypothetical protein